jgi:hypothetical protein
MVSYRFKLLIRSSSVWKRPKKQHIGRYRVPTTQGYKAPGVGVGIHRKVTKKTSSRLIHLKEGDACTKIFHHKAKGRRKTNMIAYLKTEDNNMAWKLEEKENIVFQYFSIALGTRVDRGYTFDWDWLNLSKIGYPSMDAQFLHAELTNVVKELTAV